MSESLKRTTAKGFVWSAIERMSGQIVGFVVIVIMSRVLSQADYGMVGMLLIFIDIAQTITDSGVTQALIRKQDRTQKDCSTAFYFNFVLSLCLYAVLYISAPLIADFYGLPELVPLARVISISVVINALTMVQKALYTVEIDFKTQTKASLTSAILSGVLGIYMAYSGYGVWSIVYYQLINLFLTGVLLWIFSTWRPSLQFSFKSFRYFFGFGSKLTIAGVMHSIYKDIYLAAIGKYYNATNLGFYTRAHQFGALPSYNVNNIVQRVTYPLLCKYQDDHIKLVSVFTRFIRMISFGVFPMMIGLCILAKPLVVTLLGERWSYSGDLLSILCLSMIWIPLESMNLNLLQVGGRTDCYLKCEIWKKIFGFIILIATLPLGLIVICWGQVVRAICDLIIDSYYTNKFYKLSLLRQLREILPVILYTIVMAAAMYLIMSFAESMISKLIMGMTVGFLVYIAMAMVCGSSEFREIWTLIKSYKQSKS